MFSRDKSLAENIFLNILDLKQFLKPESCSNYRSSLPEETSQYWAGYLVIMGFSIFQYSSLAIQQGWANLWTSHQSINNPSPVCGKGGKVSFAVAENIFTLRDALMKKKNGKKRGHCPYGAGGVNPSSFFKPKFTGFSNHSEMDF